MQDTPDASPPPDDRTKRRSKEADQTTETKRNKNASSKPTHVKRKRPEAGPSSPRPARASQSRDGSAHEAQRAADGARSRRPPSAATVSDATERSFPLGEYLNDAASVVGANDPDSVSAHGLDPSDYYGYDESDVHAKARDLGLSDYLAQGFTSTW